MPCKWLFVERSSGIWDSGLPVEHIWGTFDLVVFKVILEAYSALVWTSAWRTLQMLNLLTAAKQYPNWGPWTSCSSSLTRAICGLSFQWDILINFLCYLYNKWWIFEVLSLTNVIATCTFHREVFELSWCGEGWGHAVYWRNFHQRTYTSIFKAATPALLSFDEVQQTSIRKLVSVIINIDKYFLTICWMFPI